MKKLNKKGFTLVELLAVVVILALLMVVLMSTMGNAQSNAEKGALQTEAMKLVSNYEVEQKSAAMIGTTPVASGKKTIGSDYTYSIVVNPNTSSADAGKVTQYCVIYKDKYSVYGDSVPAEKPTVYEKDKTGSCTIADDGTITQK